MTQKTGRSFTGHPLAVGLMMASLAWNATAFQLEEVVVTAQKRAQNLNDVGIAVTAFTGSDITAFGMEQPSDLAAQTPSLTVKNASGNTAPVFTVRGVGLNAFVSNVNPSVAVYLDEVYQVNTSMMSFGLFDLERVEVLKGPQGTLFGRNTTGGAVSFVTNKPSDEFEAYVAAGIGDYQLTTLEGAVGGAITETLNGRLSATSTRQKEGFFTNRTTGKDHGQVERQSWRAQLAWEPTDSFSGLLNVHGGKDRSDQWMLVHRGLRDEQGNPCPTVVGPSCYDALGYRDNDGDFYRGDYNREPSIDNQGLGATLTMEWDLGDLTFTAVTNHEDFEYYREEEFDASPNTLVHTSFDGEVEQFSQELRVSTDRWDHVTLIAGLFYSQDTLHEHDFYNLNNNPLFATSYDVDFEQETTTTAAFIHTEWQINDEYKLTLGARVTDEEVTFDGGTVDLFPQTSGLGQFGLTGGQLNDKTISVTEPTGKIALDWTPNNDWLFYASYSRGFKSGGFNGSFTLSVEEAGPFDKETIDAYELGFKATLADNRLQFNGAFYHYDYQDLQIFDTDVITSAFLLDNAGNAEVRGFELEVRWLATEALDIRLGLGFSDTEIVEYKTNLGTDAEGNRLANTPELTVNSVISYRWQLPQNYLLKAALDMSWQDDIYFSIANDPRASEDSYLITNASLTLSPEDEQWQARAWVKNLNEEEYFTEQFIGGPAGLASGTIGAPRTFGVELTYHWN
ncbi:TonB-dependent receptor [Pseudomaricurvus alkylphenolicus]|uniref:TonB-dependent receptor n=1 Tax=Pseudomaricurvus alkylphenolicus TaxID=1306991 RepID=UPI00141FF4C6|nr:TonB-dependent receptor [Pseudomaricurvus alkylphenolicus]NIB40776.1 TonB-dependent receptor [Pseudomaricurvus alkylphenolicus]